MIIVKKNTQIIIKKSQRNGSLTVKRFIYLHLINQYKAELVINLRENSELTVPKSCFCFIVIKKFTFIFNISI